MDTALPQPKVAVDEDGEAWEVEAEDVSDEGEDNTNLVDGQLG